MRRITLIFFTTFLLTGLAFSTAIAQNLSTEGRDFWLGYMNSWLQSAGNQHILELYISAEDSTSGVVEMPLAAWFTPMEFNVLPGVTTRLVIPNEAMAQGTNTVEDKGIHILTDKDVSVYAMNKRQYSADMAVVLPTYSLSNDYYVLSHWEDGNRNNNDNSDSECLIVALGDQTQIEIIPTVTTEGGNPAGVPFNITLNKGQTYEVQARADLTGTKVTGVDNGTGGCQNFALFAGNQYTQVGACGHENGHEHLYAQMYPVKTWGLEYITVPFAQRMGGDVIKILAAYDNTELTVNGTVHTLDKTEYLSLQLELVSVINSNKPISVGQFGRSGTCDGMRGDPFMIIISPNEQLLQKITYNSPTIATVDQYYLNIVTPTANIGTVEFDGNNISSTFQAIPGKTDYAYTRFATPGGNHIIEASEGFIAYVYGYGGGESFGYATGAGLSNLSLAVRTTNSMGAIVPSDSICLNDVTYYTPVTTFDYDAYTWEFGDGSVFTTTDKDSLMYQYNRAGNYVFRLSGINTANNCAGANADTEVKVISVINPKLKIRGPRSTCPNTLQVSYWVEGNEHFQNEWFVGGGTIVENFNDSIVVDWGKTNPHAFVKLLSRNQYHCYGDTVTLPVKINIQLDPEAPFGIDSLCVNHVENIRYYAYYTQGSTYQWHIENGEIVSGQGTHDVRVSWHEVGSGKLWFDQLAITDTLCDGISDTLLVWIQRLPSDVAEIVTAKLEFEISEPVPLNFETDTLYRRIRLMINGDIQRDSIPFGESVELAFHCAGIYQLEIEAYDAVGVCDVMAYGSKSVTVLAPAMEIINVTNVLAEDSLLAIQWNIRQLDYFNRPFSLQKLRNGSWQNIESIIPGSVQYEDRTANPDSKIEEYRLFSKNDCGDAYVSEIHNNILLEVRQEEEDKATISWNPYINWQHDVEAYEVYLAIDGAPPELMTTTNGLELNIENDSLGFDYCFRIKAVEREGNERYSWSNEACAYFVPPLYAYNIITPNGDDINDNFVIDNVELYPNSVLHIYNRWGRPVYEQKGYLNDWYGTHNGTLLPNGVYYFALELNEPRAKMASINGMVSILK